MDFKNFKKVSDDPKSAVMQNNMGHKIHIVKDALTPSLRKRLEQLPLHQAQGSNEPVQDPNLQSTEDDLIASGALPRNAMVHKQGAEALPDFQAAPEQQAPQVPQDQPTAQAPAEPQPPAAGMGAAAGMAQGAPTPDPTAEAVNQLPGGPERMKALQLEAQGLQTESKGMQGAYSQNADSLQSDLASFQKDTQTIKDQIQKTTADIAGGHINPNAYLENKSTGGKIATAIGLLLGGISSGLTGKSNPVMDFLNHQIDRNLEAQKADMANKHNLLSALGEQYKNEVVRDSVFRSINANVMADQVGAAKAAALTPQAQAAQQQGIGELKQQAGLWARQAAMGHMEDWVKGAPSGQAGVDARAQTLLTYKRQFDPQGAADFEKRYIPGVGVANVPIADKDRETLAKKTELQSLLGEADAFLKKSGTTGPILPANRAEGEGLQNRINLRMGELVDLTRFTPEENKIYRKSVPMLGGGMGGTHFTGSDQKLLDSLKQENNDSLNTFYKQKGLNVPQAGSEERVTVIAPDGKSGTVSKDSLQGALAKGYRQVSQ